MPILRHRRLSAARAPGEKPSGGSLIRLAVEATVGGLSVGGAAVLIGYTAPRWPDRWLNRDVGPLRLLPFESREFYERLGISFWKRILPDGGEWFGGSSKSKHPDPAQGERLGKYLVELRRGEWVHWLSNLTWIPIWWFADRRPAVGVAGITFIVNGLAIGTLRYHRLRAMEAAHPVAEGEQAPPRPSITGDSL